MAVSIHNSKIKINSIQYDNGKNTFNSVSCSSDRRLLEGYVFLSLNKMYYLDQHNNNSDTLIDMNKKYIIK